MTEATMELIQSTTDDDLEVLLPCEQEQLAECEKVIKKGLGTFLDVGRALADIRDNRLYREKYSTFEKYCKEVWDLGKTHAYGQIEGYQTVRLLESKCPQLRTNEKPCCDETLAEFAQKCGSCEYRKALANRAFKGVRIPWAPGKCTRPEGLCMEEPGQETATPASEEIILPMNEAQARPLSKLTPDQQVEAWGLVLDWVNGGAKLTSYLVGKAVKEVRGEVTKRKVKDVKKEVESTELVSRLFKKQYQVMLDIISGEQNSGWKSSSKKEMVKWLKNLVKIAESEE